jgi:hypothetical protein
MPRSFPMTITEPLPMLLGHLNRKYVAFVRLIVTAITNPDKIYRSNNQDDPACSYPERRAAKQK